MIRLEKRILIIYQPAFGGNFLKTLLSLDPCTVPYRIFSNNIDERKEAVSFKHAKEYDHHQKWHLDTNLCQIEECIIHLKNTTLIEAHHPDSLKFLVKPYMWDLHFVVSLDANDPFSEFWVSSFKKKWSGWPPQMPDDINEEMKYRNVYKPLEINMTNFLYQDLWYKEYEKINHELNLPCYFEQATELYNDWYNNRVLEYKQIYYNIT